MRYEHKHEREKYSTTTIQVSAELSCDGWLLVVLLCLAQQRESSQSVGLRKGKERREKTWHCRSMLDLIQCVVAGAHHGRQKGQHHARRELMTIGAHRCEILCDRPTGGNRWRFNICHFGKFFLFLFFKDLDFVAQPVNLDGNYVTNRVKKGNDSISHTKWRKSVNTHPDCETERESDEYSRYCLHEGGIYQVDAISSSSRSLEWKYDTLGNFWLN